MFVAVLATLACAAEPRNLYIVVSHGVAGVLLAGQNRNGHSGRMNPTLALGWRYTLNAMPARLILEAGEVFSCNGNTGKAV